MVQLPATAAIEYVAACWVSVGIFVRGCFCPGGLLPGGTFVRGAYARSPQVQCVYAPSRFSVPSIVVWRTNKQTNRQKKQKKHKDKLGPVAPRGVDPRSPNF